MTKGATVAQDLTRITVNLVPGAASALEEASAAEQLSQTDTVNRALQVYEFLVKQKMFGKELLLRSGDGSVELVHIV